MKPQQKWSEAEHFVWEKTCAGEQADFNSRENKKLDPKSPDGWDNSRRLSSEFLETILFEKPFREVVTRKGVRIIGAYFPEKIDLEDGHLPWSLELHHSRFENGLNMSGLQADGQVSFNDSVVKGKLGLGVASIGNGLFMRRATFEKVDLRGAQIGGHLVMDGATVTGELDMDSISIRGALLMAECARFEEKVILRGAQIQGQLAVRYATVTGKLNMDSVSVGSNLLMTGGDFATVKLDGATIGSMLNLTDGSFGKLELTGATVGRELQLITDNKSVKWQSDSEIQPNEIRLNLRNTQVGTLVDSPESWPAKIELRGFTYRQLGGARQEDEGEPSERPAEDFIKWLGRNETFSFQPYQQLATVLHNAGKSSTADRVLFAAKEREREKAKGREKAWLSVLRFVIGYGIGRYTFRALYWAIFFVLFGWGVLCLTGEDQKHEETITVDEERTVGKIGFWFSLDYLLPAVRLREAHYTKVDLSYGVRIYFYVHQLIGYILVFFLIAALTGITQPSNGRGPPE